MSLTPAPPRSGRLRRVLLLAPPFVAASMAVIVLVVPEGRLRCDPTIRERSPDGAWSLSVCPRQPFFAMPGQGSDAPAWIVLRDREGLIRGVCNLDMLQAYGAGSVPTEWGPDRVDVPLTVVFPLVPPGNGAWRWVEDHVWRLRALFGLVPDSRAYH